MRNNRAVCSHAVGKMPRWSPQRRAHKRGGHPSYTTTNGRWKTPRGTNHVYRWISDGGGRGAAAVSPTEVRSLGCPSRNITNNELELLAIALAVAEFKDFKTRHPSATNRLTIFSDSQTALKHVTEVLRQRPMQHLARSVKRFINELKDTEVIFYWVPGHEDIEENEAADKAAKEAAEVGATNAKLLPTSLSKLAQETRTTFHLRTADFTTGRKELKTQPRKIADSLSRLEKGQAAAIFQIRSGHCPLNEYLRRFNHHPTGKCDICKSPETVSHFILYCKNFKQQRRTFRKRLQEDEIKVNQYSLTSWLNTPDAYPRLAEFILNTGQFTYLKSYLSKEKTSTTKKPKTRRPTR